MFKWIVSPFLLFLLIAVMFDAWDDSQYEENVYAISEQPSVASTTSQTTLDTVPQLEANYLSSCYTSKSIDSMYARHKDDINAYEEAMKHRLLRGRLFRLNDDELATLSKDELIVYCLAFPEYFTQVCAMPWNFENGSEVIYDRFEMNYSLRRFSKKQDSLLLANRNEALGLLNACDSINWRWKDAVIILNAQELSPRILEHYKTTNDDELLTILWGFMKRNEFDGYINSKFPSMIKDANTMMYKYLDTDAMSKLEFINLCSDYAKRFAG